MQDRCRQILIALKSGDSDPDNNILLAHLENCPACRRVLELPPEISNEIGNINLLPAPEKIYENTMAALRSQHAERIGLHYWRLTRIGAIMALYLSIFFFIANNWNTLMANLYTTAGDFILLFKANASNIPAQFDTLSNITGGLSRSPIFLTSILMSVTIIWTFTLIKIRDTLKS